MNIRALAILFSVLIILSGESSSLAQEWPSKMSPFGIGSCHSNNWSAQANEPWMPKMRAIGVSNHRTCQTAWDAVESEHGNWRWDLLDQQIKYLEDQQISFGGILIGNPAWNAKDKAGSLPVNSLTQWSEYVTQVVTHTKGKINHWEVWNEPPNFTGSDQTPADYAKIVIAAYDAAKAADPTCKIGIAAKSVHVNYLEQAIASGAKDHFDYITLHPYEVLNGVAEDAGTEPIFMNIVPTVRKMLETQNPANANVPVIFTELGCDANKGEEVQAKALVKAYTLGIAQGVTCIQWFEAMDGDSGPMGLLDGKGNARPAYTALAQLIKHLGQYPKYDGWILLNDRNYGFVFQGAEKKVLVAWGRKGESDTMTFNQPSQIVDPITGKSHTLSQFDLTSSPIFVIDPPITLVRNASSHRGMPLPWGGDYQQASAVSITMGESTVEKGLHTMAGKSVAEAVIAYGGSARAGSVPGGNVYIVDPAFLCYTTTPIEIAAVVRRNEANDNSGFKLIYESTSGLKTAGGWYTVPDNKEWHTIKWTIDDAQFVNYWGYNFALESDGNVYNKYYIQSVTVTKLDQR